MLLRPRKTVARAARRASSAVQPRGSNRATNGYVSLSHGLIRKPLIGLAILLLFTAGDGVLGTRLPTSFLPEEDYGYCLLNVQLPPAASLDRTDAVAHKIDDAPAEDRGRASFNTIVGFSLLTRVTASNNAFFFVQLTPWDERRRAAAAGARDRQPAERRSLRADRAGGGGVRGHAAVDSRTRQRRAASRCGSRIAAAARSSSSTSSCRSSWPRRASGRSSPA